MNYAKIRLKPEHRLAVEKVVFETVMARSNLVFFINKHLGDGDADCLSEDLFDKLMNRYLIKYFDHDVVVQGICDIVTGVHDNNIMCSFDKSTHYILLQSQYDIPISPNYRYVERGIGYGFVQFQDFIAQCYPEYFDPTLEGSDRVLTRSVTFQVTDACNLRCSYCYQINKGARKMKLEDAKLFVDKLLSGKDGFDKYVSPSISPGITLEFIGGEPLLEVDLIDKIVDYFRMRCLELQHPWAEKFCISLCSNGVLYTDPAVQKFLQKNYDCISFSVTLDGNKELHDSCRVFPDGSGSYDIAVSAATDWMSRGYYMGSKITISPTNLPFIFDALMHVVSLGYQEVNANCVFEAEWTEQHAKQLYQLLKQFSDFLLSEEKYRDLYCSLFLETLGRPKETSDLENWCGGTGVMLSMDPDGWLYPCIRYMESSLGQDQVPMRIGNVHTSLGMCKEDKECVECLQCITRRTQSTDECFFCPIAEGCAWCSAYNYQVYGTADRRVTKICPMHKARVLANVYHWNNYYRKYGIDRVFDMWIPQQWAVQIIGAEEYNELVKSVKEMGGFINESEVTIRDYEPEDNNR